MVVLRASCFVLPLVLAGLPRLSANGQVSPRATPLQKTCSAFDHAAARLRGGVCMAGTSAGLAPATGYAAMLDEIKTWHPVMLGFLGTCFGWFMTALGSAAVVIHHLGLPEDTYRKVLDFMLGVSGGVMTAASYWSLLAPALEFAEAQGWGERVWVPVALGFLSGGVLLQARAPRASGSIDPSRLLPHGAQRPKPAAAAWSRATHATARVPSRC